jgi:hypothetical protein
MDALDLTKQPPAHPRTPLGDLDVPMLARTVDKLRAEQAGGDIGAYNIDGFSSRALDMLGVDREDLRDEVERAKSNQQVATWIRAHTTPEKCKAVVDHFEAQTLASRLERPGFVDRYPVAKTMPPTTNMLDLLAADDASMFS